MTERDDAGALSPSLPVELRLTREQELQGGLEQLSALVLQALSLEDLLGEVARAAADAVPGADGVGVTLLRLDQPTARVQALGASHPFVEQIDVIQYELVDEGPCISAAREDQIIVSASLIADPRWPRFGPRVGRLGVRAALSLPMRLRNQTVVGALNCYSRTEDAFDEEAARLGMLFAGPAAVAVHNSQILARAHSQTAQLQAALTSRAMIDQAIGIIRGRSGVSADEAFNRLREISQSENVKLSVIAERLVEEAVRRARSRRGSTEDLPPAVTTRTVGATGPDPP